MAIELDGEQQHNFNINYGSFSQKINFNATVSYAFTRNAVTRYSFIPRVIPTAVMRVLGGMG